MHERSFGGNPASVIVLSSSPEDQALAANDALMQKIGMEFNLSETAFCNPLPGGTESEPKYEIRWFTPATGPSVVREASRVRQMVAGLTFCHRTSISGHATLASAHVLFTTFHPTATRITFSTRKSGSLSAVRHPEDGSISLDFPAGRLTTLEDGHRRRPKIVDAVIKVVKSKEAIKRVDWWDPMGCLIELGSEVDLEKLEVDAGLLSNVGDLVILTQPAPVSSGFDIYSRVFAPDLGIPEDPVTGAAHTALAPFWLSAPSISRLPKSSAVQQTSSLKAKQVSKRGGEMVLALDRETGRVELRGFAKTVMRGEIDLGGAR
ncbi:SPOSA6832_02681, partial [Sporobolomyces salmonicolor]